MVSTSNDGHHVCLLSHGDSMSKQMCSRYLLPNTRPQTQLFR